MRQLSMVFTLLGLGCSVAHVDPYVPKQRKYEAPAAASSADERPSPGSLWQPGQGAAVLFGDARALRQGDLVVVRVEEVASAKRSADTEVKRDSTFDADVAAFLRTMAAAQFPQMAAEGKVSLGVGFDGQGTTGRSERFTATVPALVRTVLPNGNLFIEGHRVVLVNAEEHHFYISGVVRPIDIDQANSVKSSMIADAEIEFTGRGVLTDNQRQGWLARFIGWVWPF